jgi:phosphoesterase RecJ-like protein
LNSDVSTINIDHHMTNLNFGAVNLVQAERASTAEILLQLIDALDVQLDEPTAICLLAGMVTDTQGFTTANVTPATLEAASRLVAAGADLAYIANMAYSRRSLPALRLWGIGLANMRLEEGILWTTLSRAARCAEGLDEVTDRGLSSLLISADEANIAAVLQEKPDGRIEISLRARPGYDVASVALALGGGGHLLAAGATIDGPLDEAVKLVIGMLKTQVLSEQTEVPTPEG